MLEHDFPNFNLINHPLLQHKITLMRDKTTLTVHFRDLVREAALLMGYEAMRDLPLRSREIETPMMTMNAPLITGKKVAVISILRAGLGMAEGIMQLIPSAREGHIGLYRDPKTQRPVEYMVKLPENEDLLFFVVDPMIATGYTAAYAVDIIKNLGVSDENIRVLSLIAAPEGLNVFFRYHPEVEVYSAALDIGLDENGYILPGLGDAGDRLFGTK